MLKSLTTFFRRLLDLREGAEEKHVIIDNVKDDSDISSARFWTLVFAIGAASVGLNINSIPVVIGAMLISPLMGPIVSIGLALAINDWGLMRRSLRNLIILATISIVISTIYFALTPITNAQSELLSRTQPTIFDVLVAIFGGMAGFIGISRARHTNIIPGVAIATALIPPLCTVGYGIATLQPVFIFGAFYLFLINCIFICLSALFVSKYLKLPKVEYPDQVHQRRVRRIIAVVIIIIITPAAYLAYTFVEQNNFNQHVSEYVSETFEKEGYVIIYQNTSYTSNPKTIELAFLSKRFTDEQLHTFETRLTDFKLKGTKLIIRQNGFALTEEEWKGVLAGIQSDEEKAIALEARLESERLAFRSPEQLLEEAKAIDARVSNIAFGALRYGSPTVEEFNDPVVLIVYTDPDQPPLNVRDARVLSDWLLVRLGDSSVVINFVPTPVATAVIEEVTPEE